MQNGKAVTSLSISLTTPKRGEIWRVSFDPTIGAEITKARPAVVISSDAVGRLPIKLVAPITDWKDYAVVSGMGELLDTRNSGYAFSSWEKSAPSFKSPTIVKLAFANKQRWRGLLMILAESCPNAG